MSYEFSGKVVLVTGMDLYPSHLMYSSYKFWLKRLSVDTYLIGLLGLTRKIDEQMLISS